MPEQCRSASFGCTSGGNAIVSPRKIITQPAITAPTGVKIRKNGRNLGLRKPEIKEIPNITGIVPMPKAAINNAPRTGDCITAAPASEAKINPHGKKPLPMPAPNIENKDLCLDGTPKMLRIRACNTPAMRNIPNREPSASEPNARIMIAMPPTIENTLCT